jgi:hypothetical protein
MITGDKGSGKTTLAALIKDQLEAYGYVVYPDEPEDVADIDTKSVKGKGRGVFLLSGEIPERAPTFTERVWGWLGSW